MMKDTSFSVTPSAASRIAHLIATEPAPEKTIFRVAVLGGGCSGFQYHFDLTTDPIEADDLVIREAGATVVVDETSLDLVRGSVLDYSESLVGAAFEIKNPQAASGCGCGNSFSVKL